MSGANGAGGFRCTLSALPDGAHGGVRRLRIDAARCARGSRSRRARAGQRAAHGERSARGSAFRAGALAAAGSGRRCSTPGCRLRRHGVGTAVEVEGKWTALELDGPDAARLLSSSLDVAAVLESRDCAAVVLFDCPAVLAKSAQGYLIYVQSSYAADFKAAVVRLCTDR